MSLLRMSDADNKGFGKLMKESEDLIRQIQQSDDVDEALQLFEQANAALKECEAKIESTRGKFEKLISHQT
jgi:exodeoxyribonuclease VII small subunit